MGSDGASFSAPLVAEAERLGWILVAPTFGYGDWRDPEQVRRDDSLFLAQLKGLIDSIPARTGLSVNPRVLLYGFSRGGQTAHRFASFYPRYVLGVVSFSCGTYTLPYAASTHASAGARYAFPFGLSDLDRYTGRSLDLPALRQVRFLLGVGAADNDSRDVPHQWDSYLGNTRVERAWSYYRALQDAGIQVEMAVFPNVGHAELPEMRTRAIEFLANLLP
jgi:pimeloyl-ACP methyl ester carboxylesterase